MGAWTRCGLAAALGVLLAGAAWGASAPAGPVTLPSAAPRAADEVPPAAASYPGPLASSASWFTTAAPGAVSPDLLAGAASAKAAPASRGLREHPAALGTERARILLRSLTLPGWGQATLGRPRAAAVFGVMEAAIWGAFTAFHIQDAIRRDNYVRLASISAGIDLRGRDEEWLRIVGGFSSSDEYNRLVVARDAANLYYNDPAAYRAYIEQHSLAGANAWSWSSPEAQDRYRSERKYAQRAAQRANTALAIAVANRIVSAVHAARVAGHAKESAHAWRLEAVPVAGRDPAAFQLRVRAQF